jgi:GH43 family beta-xylosidase
MPGMHRRRAQVPRRWVLVIGGLVVLLVAGALVYGLRSRGASASGSHPPAQSAATPLPATTTTAPPAADPAAPARIVTSNLDVPNPFVLYDRGTYYLYSSQYGFYQPNIPVRTSTSAFGGWSTDTDAMPNLQAWVRRGFTWAPDVRYIDGRYVMWFTGWLLHHDPITECIGVATSNSPLGPFTGPPNPSICQLDRNGSIDPRTFVDAKGNLWLDWKSDDNADLASTAHTTIYAQRLSPDGLSLVGQPTEILQADQPWEGRIVEAPQMIAGGGHLWVFYSGNWFNQPDYAIGVAECDTPAGPCHKPFSHSWLGSNLQGSGPGEESLFTDPTGTWIVYSPLAVRYRTDTKRPVALAKVAFGPLGPYLAAF